MPDEGRGRHTASLNEILDRPIPVAAAPMVHHLWAAYESAGHLTERERRDAQATILRALDEVTAA